MNKSTAGFSLVELLVAITIIGLLSSVLYFNISKGAAQSRDAERQADLRNLQSAIELYKNKEGRYPAGCNGPDNWSGQAGTSYACPAGHQFIEGHSVGIYFAPKYIPTLPTDPKLNGVNSGYVYTVNADGSVYKLIAFQTVEALKVVDTTLITKIVPELREFKLCDTDNISLDPNLICLITHGSNGWGGVTPNHCKWNDVKYQTSYAVWGGYANMPTAAQVEQFTERIVCKAP